MQPLQRTWMIRVPKEMMIMLKPNTKRSRTKSVWTIVLLFLALSSIPLCIVDLSQAEWASAAGEGMAASVLLGFAWAEYHDSAHSGTSRAYREARSRYDAWVEQRMYRQISRITLIACALTWTASVIAYKATGNTATLSVALGAAPAIIVNLALAPILSLWYGHRFEKTHDGEATWFLNPER